MQKQDYKTFLFYDINFCQYVLINTFELIGVWILFQIWKVKVNCHPKSSLVRKLQISCCNKFRTLWCCLLEHFQVGAKSWIIHVHSFSLLKHGSFISIVQHSEPPGMFHSLLLCIRFNPILQIKYLLNLHTFFFVSLKGGGQWVKLRSFWSST